MKNVRLFQSCILVPTLIVAAIAASLLFFGCGGGGGNPGGGGPETRSVNIVTSQFGSRFFNSNVAAFHWVGDRTNTDYGVVTIETVTKRSGVSTVSVVQGGRVLVDNTVARDTVVFDFTTHYAPGDPNAGKPLSGTATFEIVPESPRVDPATTNPFTIPADASVPMAIQAQNSRAAGYAIVLMPSKTRVFVNTDASWTVQPASAGSVVKNADGTATFAATAGYAGPVTISATLQSITGPFKATISGTVVAHPTVVITSPTENQIVSSGTMTVQFSTSNAISTTYSLDGGTAVGVSGSFTVDTTALANGAHSLTMKALGQLETASQTRNFTVNNQVALKNGKMVLNGPPIPTNSDGQNIPNNIGGRAANGSLYAGVQTMTFMDASGVVIKRVNGTISDSASTLIGDRNLIAVPDRDNGKVLIFDLSGNNIRTLSGFGYVLSADYMPGQKILTASPLGIYSIDPVTWNKTFLIAGSFGAASGNGNVIFATEFGNGDKTAIYDYSGNKIKDLGWIGGSRSIRIVPGWDLVIVSVGGGPQGTGVYQYKLDGTLIEFNSFGIAAGKAWYGFDRDWQHPDGMLGATFDATLQPFKVQ